MRLLWTGSLLVLICCSAPEPTHVRPNVIVILVDTLRADYLGVYGFEGDISPGIDRLASESVRFTRCVSQAPWTKPALASLFTSLHPLTHRVTDHQGLYLQQVSGRNKTSALSEDALTLAESMHSAGYTTVAWVANGWITRKLGFAQGFDEFYGASNDVNIMDADKIWKPAWGWLEARRSDAPFFMYLHFMDVHGPWQWHEKGWNAIRNSPSLGANRRVTRRELGKLRYLRGRSDLPTPEGQLRTWRAAYGAGVRAFDEKLTAFLDHLRSSGLLENTILVFTADHGEELLEHNGWGHGYSLHSDQTHVPLLVRLPEGANGGRTIERVVSLIDIMPTLMEATGIAWDADTIQGQSLWKILEGAAVGPRSGLAYAGADKNDPKLLSIEDGRFKLIWAYPDGPRMLFDLTRDPMEQRNIAPAKTGVTNRLSLLLAEQVSKLRSVGTLLEATSELDEEEVKRLRSLGYVE